MAWGTMRTVVGGTDTILASDHNTVRGNLLVISPDGVVHTFVQQSSTPSAPGARAFARSEHKRSHGRRQRQ